MEDEQGPGAFRPPDLTTSKLRFYSMGICAENKKLGSMEVEVTPTEELTMLNGEVTTQQDDYRASAQDTLGKTYDSNVKAQNSVKATWLRFGEANRMTAPDVRRGEAVMLYQFGDANQYYWMTIKQDAKLRRLETVVWALSASKTEGAPMDPANTYYLEISTHKGLAHFHTSTANGEPFGYDLQFNTKEGAVTLADTAGNYFVLNSTERRLEMYNVDGSHWDMNKKELTMTIPDRVTTKTKHFQVDADTATINAKTNVTKDTSLEQKLNVTMQTTLTGGLTLNQTQAGGGGGKNRIQGGLIIEDGGLEVTGEALFHNNVAINADLAVQGYSSLSGGYG